MLILSFDACCGACSASVAGKKLYDNKANDVIDENNEILSYEEEKEEHKQAEKLINIIEKTLYKACCNYDDVSYLAVTIGPGSFTGIRIGLSAAYGISLSTGIPIIPVNTIDAVLNQAIVRLNNRSDIVINNKYRILIALNAGRQNYYVQEFFYIKQKINGQNNYKLITLNDIALFSEKQLQIAIEDNSNLLAFGNVAHNLIVNITPNAIGVARSAIKLINSEDNLANILTNNQREHLKPLYIREPDIG